MSILIVLLGLALSVFAQLEIGISLAFPREFQYPCNSAAVASGLTHFNVDFIDTLNGESTTIFPVTSAETHISTNAGTSWLAPISMTNIGSTHYIDTWESSRTNAASGAVEYYFKCETESTLTTECPDNIPTSFPLDDNKAAQIGDASGDQLDVDGYSYSSLDIQNFRASYDNDEFFFRVNIGSGWADSHREGGFFGTTYYHAMIIPLLNNESPIRDSVFFGIVIANLDLLGIIDITDGLYKFWAEDGDDDYLNNFERISSVTFSPSNPDGDADFSVRLPISALTSNGWGTWPNESHAIGTGCATIGLWIISIVPPYSEENFGYVITDITKSSGVICQTHSYNIGSNSPPTLTPSHLVDYLRDTTWIDLSCTYTDADGNLPTSRQLTIDDGARTAYTIGSDDHSYSDGSLFEYSKTLRCEHIDSLKYKWDFDDGAGSVSTDWQYAVVPSEIGLQVTGGTWDVPDDLGSLDTVEMSSGDVITITNTGNCPLKLGLEADSLPNYWLLSDHTSFDTTVIFANFTDSATPPAFTSFGTNDALSTSVIWADGTTFGGGGENLSYCVDGVNSENLYLAFVVPQTYSVNGEQQIKLALWASSDLP